MPVAGVFFNPFQHAPADFNDSGFVRAREAEINHQLKELAQEGVLKSQVFERFSSKFGLQNPMVNWRYLNEELLEFAMERIPIKDWLAVFNRLLKDTRLNRSGFPDLILFPATDSSLANTNMMALDACLLYTSPSPRDATLSRMPSSA